MKTYVNHFRYVVQYLAAGNKQPTSSFPMATYLSNRCQHYHRVSARSKAEHSWQVLDSKSQWIHWYVRTYGRCHATRHLRMDISYS